MQSSGLIGAVEAHIAKHGVSAPQKEDYLPAFAALEKAKVVIPADVKSSFLQIMTENAQQKASAFADVVGKHGLWAWHDGVYAAAKAKVAQAHTDLIRQAGADSGVQPDAERVALKAARPTAVISSAKAGIASSFVLEPMFTCGGCGGNGSEDPGGGGGGYGGANGPGAPLGPPEG